MRLPFVAAAVIIFTLFANAFGGDRLIDQLTVVAPPVSAPESIAVPVVVAPVVDDRPIIIGNSIPNCPACTSAKAWEDLPFRIVWRENASFNLSYPVFQIPRSDGRLWRYWNHSRSDLISAWRNGSMQDTARADRMVKDNLGDDFDLGLLSDFMPLLTQAVAKTISAPFLATDVEAAPTPYPTVWRAFDLLDVEVGLTPKTIIWDPGCGDARVLIEAVRGYGCRGIGTEIDAGRAADARRRVAEAGLSDRIAIIEGDATEVRVDADVAFVYLYSGTIAALKPKLEQLDAFVSYMHDPAGMTTTRHGDLYLWKKPEPQPVRTTQPVATWRGSTYTSARCSSRGCAMCNSIRAQLSGR